ncbi:MAG: cbb3-type cytochrome c oxidase subunit 3 [Bdellovibrio sp.]
MKQDGLKFFTDTQMTSLGLIIFFVFFAGVLLWVFRKSSGTLYSKMENMPLKDGE